MKETSYAASATAISARGALSSRSPTPVQHFEGEGNVANDLVKLELTGNELENRKMILEYLTVVKKKMASMERQLDDARKESEFAKRKSEDLGRIVEELHERESMMTLKYGVLASQNYEL